MEDVKVGIVGAGVAGLTAALRLAERGFKVTVFEERNYVGGKFGAHQDELFIRANDTDMYRLTNGDTVSVGSGRGRRRRENGEQFVVDFNQIKSQLDNWQQSDALPPAIEAFLELGFTPGRVKRNLPEQELTMVSISVKEPGRQWQISGTFSLADGKESVNRDYLVKLEENQLRVYMGTYHEHCYHMFMNWYKNFWDLLKDIDVEKLDAFESRPTVKFLRKGESSMTEMTNGGSMKYFWKNLMSGPMPPADTYLYGYSLIDLLATKITRKTFLDRISVNGFMFSRLYSTDRSAELHQYHLAKSFAVPSYSTSAATYRDFVGWGFKDPEPLLWVMKGNCEETFHQKLKEKLESLGCEIKLNHRVTAICTEPGEDNQPQVATIKYIPGVDSILPHSIWHKGSDMGRSQPEEEAVVDYLVLAIPPKSLVDLLSTRENSVIQEDPRLEEITNLRSDVVVSLDLYFTKKLQPTEIKIPTEHVVLLGSRHDLTFIDNSQLWPDEDGTFLNIVASDADSLIKMGRERTARRIIQLLHDFITFDDDEIDWQKSHIQMNLADELFINNVGSGKFRPDPSCRIPNLFLAGDFCRNEIDVVCIEGALVSALRAVEALQLRAKKDLKLDASDGLCRPVKISKPDSVSELEMKALAFWGAPYAYAAKWVSTMSDLVSEPMKGESSEDAVSTPLDLLLSPYALAFKWWSNAFTADVTNQEKDPDPKPVPNGLQDLMEPYAQAMDWWKATSNAYWNLFSQPKR